MSRFDIPYLSRKQNSGSAAAPESINLPDYASNPAANGAAAEGAVHHNHFYQIPNEAAQRAKIPWYRRKANLYICLAIAVILAVAAVSATVGILVTMKDKKESELEELLTASTSETSSKETTAAEITTAEASTTEPSTVFMTVTQSEQSEPEPSLLLPSFLTSNVLLTSLVTVTWSEQGTTVTEAVVTTLDHTQTITLQPSETEEDVGAIISSILSTLPMVTTERLTIPSSEATSESPISISTTTPLPMESSTTTTSTTSTTISSSTSSSTSFSTSPSPSLSTSVTSVLPTTTPDTSTSSSSSSSSSTPIPTATEFPSLFNLSNIAAADVNIGPRELHRRVIVWQGDDLHLVASDSAYGSTNISVIHQSIKSGTHTKPIFATPLTGAADDTGAYHLFYLAPENEDDGDDEDIVVRHLIQYRAGEWAVGPLTQATSPDSFLSATWHQTDQQASLLVLGFQSRDAREVHLVMSDKPRDGSDPSLWQTVNLHDSLGLQISHNENHGHSIASGILYNGTGESGGGLVQDEDEPATVHCAFEGFEQIMVAKCSIDFTSAAPPELDCLWDNSTYSRETGEPIAISSHPTITTWYRQRPSEDESGGKVLLKGLFTLDESASALVDNRHVPQERLPTDDSVGNMEAHPVEGKDFRAIAAIEGDALFVRSEGQLFEYSLDGDEWTLLRELETTQE